MHKKIKVDSIVEFSDLPSPSKNHLPEWYKKSEQFVGGKPKIDERGVNRGLKLCVPFLDSMTSGYIATLWQDIIVSQENGLPWITWEVTETSYSPVDYRTSESAPLLPIPSGHSPTHFVWKNPFFFELPEGYSMLLSHPFNRFDLPFTTLSGIIDADGILARGNIPFFIKDGFEGIIKQGTPIFQIFPFKRENWNIENDIDLKNRGKKNVSLASRVIRGWYKDNIWHKKEYN